MEVNKPFERSYWVVPGSVMAGEYPAAVSSAETKRKLEGLVDAGIKLVISLTEAGEQNRSGIELYDYSEDLKAMGVEAIRMPIQDLHIPSKEEMDNILERIEESLAAQKPVYFHCWGGVGRTGTVLGCYLLKNQLATKDNVFQTIDELKKDTSIRHRNSPETLAQRNFVLNYL